ncbi:MAG: biopolymer transporter ExbD [Candidatus Aminicenantes bacterium]|nr:biopolymer transporter ExbD [Candidatus Aminicenantes bacterium]
MSIQIGGTSKAKSEPNVVPLCDILLVLLIIFMVITPVAQRGIDIQLPESGKGGEGTEIGKIVLTIEKNQTILLNKSQVDKDMLLNRLKDLYQTRQEKIIFIQADTSLPYNFVLGVIDIAKGAGVETLGVMTTAYETGEADDSVSPDIETEAEPE